MPHTNRLAAETSPYLLQHAHNPVDWFPWGEEAFLKSRTEQKPIFLSIGYSTCHWCHVMERESFENEETARTLNENFINIKVDREERPDVDSIYMAFVQATTGSGGWPMSVWLTPELQPFVGGTYFPPQDNYGRAGFPTVLERISEAWETKRAGVLAQGAQMSEALQWRAAERPPGELTSEPLRKIFDYAVNAFDAEWGGFGSAPKFPRPAMLNILIRCSKNPLFTNAEQTIALRILRETLRFMARGGMHDQLGGGFHRYSVDRFWHVPHFEKMLYDQAQLAIAYLEHWQRSSGGESASREIAIDILEYVARELLSPEGGFYSAEDADSLTKVDGTEKVEGAFYAWRKDEIESLLGEDADIFCQFYDVQPMGNAPDGSDPHGDFVELNILHQPKGLTSLAKTLGISKQDLEKSLASSREKLFKARAKRPRPHRDEKILTSWNGLMISAYARCGAAFGEEKYLTLAEAAADLILTKSRTEEGALARSLSSKSKMTAGFTDDYAFLIQGLLDLYEATFEKRWLSEAVRLQEEQDASFYDEENGGYFATRADATDVIARLKDDYDGAEPAANSVAANNLLRLSTMMDRPELREKALFSLRGFATVMEGMPHGCPQMLAALDLALAAPQQLVLVGDPNSKDFLALAREAWRRFLPHVSMIAAKDSPMLALKVDGRATAYLCENFACQLPVTQPEELARLLDLKPRMDTN